MSKKASSTSGQRTLNNTNDTSEQITLSWRHQRGREFQERVDRGERVTVIAKACGFQEDYVRKLISFSKTFTEAEVVELSQLRMPNNEPLSWGHVLPLLTVESPRRRWMYLNMLMRENLSSREFYKKIQLGEGRTEPQSAGRKPFASNKDMVDGSEILFQIQKLSESWLKYHDKYFDPQAREPVPLNVPRGSKARQQLLNQVDSLIKILERQRVAVDSLVSRLKFATLPGISQDS